jgi:hypothetical protein
MKGLDDIVGSYVQVSLKPEQLRLYFNSNLSTKRCFVGKVDSKDDESIILSPSDIFLPDEMRIDIPKDYGDYGKFIGKIKDKKEGKHSLDTILQRLKKREDTSNEQRKVYIDSIEDIYVCKEKNEDPHPIPSVFMGFSYLDDYKGDIVQITELLDPKGDESKYSNKGKSKARLRKMIGNHENGWFHTEFDNLGDENGTQCSCPYLGFESTIWKIKREKDGKILLDHKKTGKDMYKIIGPDNTELGTGCVEKVLKKFEKILWAIALQYISAL